MRRAERGGALLEAVLGLALTAMVAAAALQAFSAASRGAAQAAARQAAVAAARSALDAHTHAAFLRAALAEPQSVEGTLGAARWRVEARAHDGGPAQGAALVRLETTAQTSQGGAPARLVTLRLVP